MNSKKILIVVDMQKDFIDGSLGSKEAQAIVANVAQKVKEADKNGDVIIFTRDTHHQENYMETEEGKNLPVPHCVKYSSGWVIDEAIPVPERAHVFDKEAFGSYDLGTYLKCFEEKEVESIELVGLCTDICVISNVVVAKTSCPNAHVVVDAACCAGVTPESHDTALQAMKAIQVEVLKQGQEPWRK